VSNEVQGPFREPRQEKHEMVLPTGLKTKLNPGVKSFHRTELKTHVPKARVKQGLQGEASD